MIPMFLLYHTNGLLTYLIILLEIVPRCIKLWLAYKIEFNRIEFHVAPAIKLKVRLHLSILDVLKYTQIVNVCENAGILGYRDDEWHNGPS